MCTSVYIILILKIKDNIIEENNLLKYKNDLLEVLMLVSELSKLSIDILSQYYENNLNPFFNHLHENILWIGPAKNQIIRSKDKLIEAFKKENNNLQFKVYNLSATPVSISSSCCEVLLCFIVDTFWPDGSTNRVSQRISLTWQIKKEQAQIIVCHISNAIDYDARDTIYPIHYYEDSPEMPLYKGSGNKVFFKGLANSIHYIYPDAILYMESMNQHTIIHLPEESFECCERLSSIAKRLNGGFIRIHASYLVNPQYVQSIQRFSVHMDDGAILPIPEKKYTKVKSELLKRFDQD